MSMEQQPMTQPQNQPFAPGSVQELKQLVQQFAMFLPEDKRGVIQETIADLEANGGIRDEAHGQQLVSRLLQTLGLSGMGQK